MMVKNINIIANILSGSGKGENVLRKVQQNLQSFHASFITYTTQYKGHSIELTNQILAKHQSRPIDAIMVVGGDGTLHEVVATIMKTQQAIPVIYLAAGTGNDFKRTWAPDATIESTLKQFFINKQPITVPILETFNHQTDHQDIILNSLGFGFDGKVISKVNNSAENSLVRKVFNGKFSYLFNVFKAMRQLDHFNVELTIDDKQYPIQDCQLISLMNSPYLGGGIKLSNDVIAKESIIGVVAFNQLNMGTLLKLFWEILVVKKTPQKNYFFDKGQVVSLKVDQSVLSQVDGELRQNQQDHLTITVNEFSFYL